MTKKEVARYRTLLGFNLAFLPGGASYLPFATGVTIDNTAPAVGDTLTGGYIYGDPQGDPEGVTLFRWLKETGAGTGIYTGVAGGNTTQYTIVQEDLGLRFIFEVLPVSTVSPFVGTAAQSSPTAPVVAGVFNPNNILSLRTWAKIRDDSTVTVSGTAPNELIDKIFDSSLRYTNFWVPGLAGAQKPLYQGNRAVFDGSIMTLTVSTTKDLEIQQGDARTFAIVFAGDSAPSQFYGLWEDTGTYTLHNQTNGLGLRDFTGTGDATTYYFHTGDPRLFDNNLHVLLIRGSAANGVKVRLDDDEETDAVNRFSLVLTQPQWGRDTLVFQGEVTEILVFDEFLSDANSDDLVDFLQTANGL